MSPDGGPARPAASELTGPDVTAYVRGEGEDHILHLMVDGVSCGGCVRKIERALAAEPDVRHARVNLSTRRLVIGWRGPAARGGALAAAVDALGYRTAPYDPDALGTADRAEERRLLRAMAVAGFAAANVMLLSVSVWAGHVEGMGEATRSLFHWFSALLVLPAVAYAGRPFFASALGVLSHRRTNMDVPISLAVLLATAMSLAETIRGADHVYFDSAITLLFFLLVGRYLDKRARGRARGAAEQLLGLRAEAVTLVEPDGSSRAVPAETVGPGATVLAAAGERIALDATVLDGRSEVDTALITGETVPQAVEPGDRVYAGTTNISAPLRLRVTAAGEDTLLAEIVRLMELAEQRRGRYVALADRVARLYAPFVHALAAVTFVGWVVLAGLGWQPALLIAVAVLIVTCPCALGLAVPAVQVIASGRLLRRGVLLKSGTALERLAEADTVVFDKTGTLTLGLPELDRTQVADEAALRITAAIAGASRHPLARALAAACPGRPVADGVREVPGRGLELDTPDGTVRLGSRDWCGAPAGEAAGPELWLARPGRAPVRFAFDDTLRPDAAETVAGLVRAGYRVMLLSGDRPEVVRRTAEQAGIAEWAGGCTPADKTARLEALAAEGSKVLMVGDGLNDAPALAAAHVSLSPSSAADIAQNAADAVFQGERLAPVTDTLATARRAGRLVRQNLGLAVAYNLVAVPLAVAGFVTPLIAAVAMSSSSLVVVGNSLRLARERRVT